MRRVHEVVPLGDEPAAAPGDAHAGPAAPLHVLRVGARLRARRAAAAPRAQAAPRRVPRTPAARAPGAGEYCE